MGRQGQRARQCRTKTTKSSESDTIAPFREVGGPLYFLGSWQSEPRGPQKCKHRRICHTCAVSKNQLGGPPQMSATARRGFPTEAASQRGGPSVTRRPSSPDAPGPCLRQVETGSLGSFAAGVRHIASRWVHSARGSLEFRA